MQPSQTVLVLTVTAVTLIAAFTDLRWRRLPNWLTVPAFLLGVIFHTATAGWAGLGYSLAGFATGFVILFVLMAIAGGAAGDVKLMGALGAWLGFWGTIYVFILSTVLVALGGLAVMMFSTLTRGWSRTARRHLNPTRDKQTVAKGRRSRLVPYAVPVAVSTWIVLLAQLIQTWAPVVRR